MSGDRRNLCKKKFIKISYEEKIKPAMDRILSFTALIVFSPLFAVMIRGLFFLPRKGWGKIKDFLLCTNFVA